MLVILEQNVKSAVFTAGDQSFVSRSGLSMAIYMSGSPGQITLNDAAKTVGSVLGVPVAIHFPNGASHSVPRSPGAIVH